ncbi:hypothetical protein CALVIDRAFT_376699 [Calocera viscosa TUFC12733]|uniref:Uncharacterized protein n=1 Tax=Calocera viscosa (strain TUFC12733) TaxID=1330018 RepID=A0A167PZH9_CALVF|nr:hypothetical protein CALVIDRAFT_376699 [Calocera viscosa TUFC12733]
MSSFFGSSRTKQEANDREKDKSTQTIRDFVKEKPGATYEFSSDDQTRRAEICRRTPDGVSCIKIEGTYKKLFETMQGMGFFCALPVITADPGKRQAMECKPLMPPK